MKDAKQKIELQVIQKEMKHPLLSCEDVTYWICRFRTLAVPQFDERRRLIDSFVNSVTIKEGSEQVTFDEIKSSDLKSVGGPCGVSLWDLSTLRDTPHYFLSKLHTDALSRPAAADQRPPYVG
ncbi:MAG: hypothetical protein HFF17_01045 [Oscillospiraceae bacterium]|nr:hypothetical protein [Oscillospiraceae bacterium]